MSTFSGLFEFLYSEEKFPVQFVKTDSNVGAPGKQSGIFGSAGGASPQDSRDSPGSFVHGKPGRDFTIIVLVSSSLPSFASF